MHRYRSGDTGPGDADGATMPADAVIALRGSIDVDLLARLLPDLRVREVDRLTDVDGDWPARAVAVILRSGVRLGAAEADRFPNLRLVLRPGSGLDNIDRAALERRSVVVRHNPLLSAAAVAEWVLLACLALCRRAALGHNGLRSGSHLKQACLGVPLADRRVAVWGAGPVGRAVARLLEPVAGALCFAAWPSVPGTLPTREPAALDRWADIHVVALPLRRSTEALFGRRWISGVAGRNPALVCVGRVETIDLPAAVDALRDGRLSGMAVDPVDPRHLDLVRAASAGALNLLLTPHIGAQRTDVRAGLDAWVARELAAAGVAGAVGGVG